MVAGGLVVQWTTGNNANVENDTGFDLEYVSGRLRDSRANRTIVSTYQITSLYHIFQGYLRSAV